MTGHFPTFDVVLYTRAGCHLCEEWKALILPLLSECGATLREVNVDSDPSLKETYGNDVPVLFLGGKEVAKHRLNVSQFRRQLQAEARRHLHEGLRSGR